MTEPRKILVVDDEPDSVEFVKVILENKEATVISANDGGAAVVKAGAERRALLSSTCRCPGRTALPRSPN